MSPSVLNEFLREIPIMDKGWAVETITCPACKVRNVNVYPNGLEKIECDCGFWMLTALGQRGQQVAERTN